MPEEHAETPTTPEEHAGPAVEAPPAPIARSPTARARWLAVATYVGPALLSLALATGMLDLWKADLRVPFDYRGDGIVSALLFKSVIENGWYLDVPQVGAPGHLHFNDFPCDSLHLLAVKALALFSHDWALLFNAYFLLGFPLITLSALAVFRHFRVPLGPAVAAAILYSFLPSRLIKGEAHMFLDVFYQVPLGLLAALWVCGDDPPLTRDRGPGLWPGLEIKRGRSILALIFCVAAALGGLYYAFFTAVLLVVGGLWAAADRRSARNAVSGLLLAGTMLLTVVVNALPSLLYIARHGKNLEAAVRAPAEAEVFGLKIIQLLLPVEGHRVKLLRAFTSEYGATAPLVNENNLVSLGVLGSIGFLILLGAVMLRPRPENPRSDLLRSLGVLNLTALLVGTLGGFGALFARLVSPALRTYCRGNVVIAFLALFALALLLERIGRRWPLLVSILPAGVLALGLFDQVTPGAIRDYARTKAEYTADGRYIRQIEGALPRDAMILQLPFNGFPEVAAPEQMGGYDHLRAYVHSHRARWSYPVMRGRPDEIWTRMVSAQPADKMVDDLAGVEFGGILIDRAGYADRAVTLEAALSHVIDGPPYVSADGGLSFFNLEAYKALPKQQLTAAQRANRRDMALHPLIFTWSPGCWGPEPGPGGPFRWCQDAAEISLDNSSTLDKTASISMTLVPGRLPCQITVDGDLLPGPFVVSQAALFERTLEVPPGVHRLRFHADGRPVIAPLDKRRLIFRADNPILRETIRP